MKHTDSVVHLCECGCGQQAPVATRTDRRAGHIKGEPQRFILGHTLRRQGSGSGHHNWRGGRVVMTNGYVVVYQPDHQRANSGYVLEHIVVAERALGHQLPEKAEVHHFDAAPGNNAPQNLVICEDRRYHALLHKRARAQAACGDANALRCPFCQGYDRQDDIRITSQGKPRHRSCERDYGRRRREERSNEAL